MARLQLNAACQVELKLKTPWRDWTTHWVMSPLEFMQRLAALLKKCVYAQRRLPPFDGPAAAFRK